MVRHSGPLFLGLEDVNNGNHGENGSVGGNADGNGDNSQAVNTCVNMAMNDENRNHVAENDNVLQVNISANDVEHEAQNNRSLVAADDSIRRNRNRSLSIDSRANQPMRRQQRVISLHSGYIFR